MNKKVLLVLIPMLSVLSLLVTPAFAQSITYPTIEANGFATIKYSGGCLSGCATLWVFTTAPTVGVENDYVKLLVCHHTFIWEITNVDLKCKVLTVCAAPITVDGTAIPAVPTSLLSPITVTIYPYPGTCFSVSAFGCNVFFFGQGHPENAG